MACCPSGVHSPERWQASPAIIPTAWATGNPKPLGHVLRSPHERGRALSEFHAAARRSRSRAGGPWILQPLQPQGARVGAGAKREFIEKQTNVCEKGLANMLCQNRGCNPSPPLPSAPPSPNSPQVTNTGCTQRQGRSPQIICWRQRLASASCRRPLDTMWSKSSPPQTYSCTYAHMQQNRNVMFPPALRELASPVFERKIPKRNKQLKVPGAPTRIAGRHRAKKKQLKVVGEA